MATLEYDVCGKSQRNKKIKMSFLAVASHCSCTCFVLISHSFETQIITTQKSGIKQI